MFNKNKKGLVGAIIVLIIGIICGIFLTFKFAGLFTESFEDVAKESASDLIFSCEGSIEVYNLCLEKFGQDLKATSECRARFEDYIVLSCENSKEWCDSKHFNLCLENGN